ncbi:MAG TPA: TetR/AcrR family transcriptional regulator [Ilumatobacteraceae bacterium]|nr:TetR/AcrR family transcriptional regulator [Ilumatobacteraceae bacterium]
MPKPYHHGALEAALADTAFEVTRAEGIAALAVRDLARHLGVSPSAAYRHFPSRDHLVARVAQRARESLAQAMLAALGEVPNRRDPQRRAIEQLGALGRAYVRFALAEPLLFEAAFVRCDVPPDRADDPDAWQLLVDAIEAMVTTGAAPAARRADGAIIAWSGVHGLATILTGSVWPVGMDADREIEAIEKAVIRSLVNA